MLGIMKAGAAFVPLDPKHPIDRLKSIARRVRAPLVLTLDKNEEMVRTITQTLGIQYMVVGSQIRETGEPFNTRHSAAGQRCMARPSDTLPSLEPFNLPVGCLTRASPSRLPPLMMGGCVCVPSDEQRLDKDKLMRFIQ